MSCIFLFLALIADVVSNTGLSLDPTFTAKGLLGLVTEMKENPGSFQGKRVLFIHTGMYDTLCKLFNWKCTLMIIFLGGFEGSVICIIKAFINIEVCMLLFRVYVLTLLRYTMSRSTLSSMIVPYRGKVWEWNGVECQTIKP